jgi:uncharacterized tellurite resistance protein B-like protein
MEQIFLPRKIKDMLNNVVDENVNPSYTIRSNGSLNGKSGEGYILGNATSIFLFSKIFGEKEFHCKNHQLAELSILKLKSDKYCSILELQTPDKTYNIKISRLEDDDCQALIKEWDALGSHPAPWQEQEAPATEPEETPFEATPAPTASPTPPPVPSSIQQPLSAAISQSTISPLVGTAAMLMFLATIDKEIDQSEDDYIRKTCMDNKAILQAGLAYYNSHSFDELIDEFRLMGLDSQQKLCIFANLCELGMSDGILHSIEQKLLQQFAQSMSISDEEAQTIRDVLLLKNQVSVLA